MNKISLISEHVAKDEKKSRKSEKMNDWDNMFLMKIIIVFLVIALAYLSRTVAF